MRVSVVVPCRNEVKNIRECITAIFESQLDSTVELSVFVVDGMSDDGTRELIQELKLMFPKLNLVDNTKQLTPFAFNLGIAAQQADYVQIVGARQILSPNYIQQAIRILERNKEIYCVGGNVENVYLNETGRVISKAMSTTFGMGLGNFRTLNESGFTDTVGTPMYPYWVFEKIGYFDEQLIRNQDDDFSYRVSKAGGKIWFESSIFLKYYVRGNFPGLWKQFFQYGYWKVFVNQKHKTFTTVRQLIPPLFVLYVVFTLFANIFFLRIGLLFDLPILVYLTLAILFTSKLKEADPELPFGDLMKTFFILHFSYGLGYLKGIYEFILLKRKPSDKQKVMSR